MNSTQPPAGADHAPTGPDPAPVHVYAVGRIGVDFRSEAHRDGFRRQMPTHPGAPPPDPGDAHQLHDHLVRTPWASAGLTWTLTVGGSPCYVLEAEPAAGMDWGGPALATAADGSERERLALLRRIAAAPPVHPVHRALREALLGGSLPADDPGRTTRLSVPGRLTDRAARLSSGRLVPVLEVGSTGLASWAEAPLIADAAATVGRGLVRRGRTPDPDRVVADVRALLDRVYVHLRNPGRSAAERALNLAVTEAFLTGGLAGDGLLSADLLPAGPDDRTAGPGLYALDTITVARSPHCRAGSDCQDVMARFLDPADDRRAPVTYLFTVDVSDELPVTLAPVHHFLG
ncbi:hypothetical protein ACFCX4_09675 [Kitasatospora sp. NPDC056327]|uniref:cyanobactin maturation protease PatG family protein n=1 Tax=Kitasatospora sp. NPDC056327 TaxID=3345785 RepID=UPI0035E05CD2